MKIEIPDCKRCCFCFPLRRGILAFGYLNLIFAALNIYIEFCLGQCTVRQNTVTIYKGVIFYVKTWLPVVLYALEIVFYIVLLVGAHLKKPSLLRAFYYYGITTTLATLVSFIFTRNHPYWIDRVIEVAIVFAGFVMTCYILLLVRAELKKLDHPHQNYIMTELPQDIRIERDSNMNRSFT